MADKELSIQKSAGKLVIFEDKQIRRIFYNGEWYFSVIDIVRVLSGSSDANRYWPELKKNSLQMKDLVSYSIKSSN